MKQVIYLEIRAESIERFKELYKKILDRKIDQALKEGGGMSFWFSADGDTGSDANSSFYERASARDYIGRDYDDYKLYLYTALSLYDCVVGVSDIDRAITAVKASGGKIIGGKMEIAGVGWFAGARDVKGNIFGLVQPTSRQPR